MELKPCPFCGCNAVISSEQRHSRTKDKFYFAGCSNSNCIAKLLCMNRYYLTKEEAIEAWNRRVQNG